MSVISRGRSRSGRTRSRASSKPLRRPQRPCPDSSEKRFPWFTARHENLSSVHPVSFADGFPFLVTSQTSLDDLNRRMPWKAEMRRFRPNVVLEGAAGPWEEDRWEQVMLGTVPVRLVKPCSRCIMTTVDPDTGERSSDGNPLKTLATFRRTDNGVIFGANGVHLETGTLRVGDPVTVQKTKESFPTCHC